MRRAVVQGIELGVRCCCAVTCSSAVQVGEEMLQLAAALMALPNEKAKLFDMIPAQCKDAVHGAPACTLSAANPLLGLQAMRSLCCASSVS
jgi:hypothetical protein